MNWWVGLLGHSDRAFARQTYIFGRMSIRVFSLVLWFSVCHVKVSLHQQTSRGFAVHVIASPNSRALWAGLCRCLCEHHPNPCESPTAVHPGSTSDVCISTQQRNKLLHRELTKRLRIRAPTDYTTIGFRAKGYIPKSC